jgi:hypothetical protein
MEDDAFYVSIDKEFTIRIVNLHTGVEMPPIPKSTSGLVSSGKMRVFYPQRNVLPILIVYCYGEKRFIFW